MGNKDPRVDAYINKTQDFTRPVLNYIRDVVREACPTVEEKIKWDFPHVDYINEMMMSMAVFKKHCTLGFWKASLIRDPKGILKEGGNTAMGQFGKITKIGDLPSKKVLTQFIKDAMRLNDEGIKVTARQQEKRVEDS